MGFDGYLNWFADSINFASNRTELPNFLEDHLFDWRMRDVIWECQADKSEGFSARLAIFNRVVNEKALLWIIQRENSAYDKNYIPGEEERLQKPSFGQNYPDLPFMNYSTRQLAEKRLHEIRLKKKKFSKAKKGRQK
jgi:hypothetical protein